MERNITAQKVKVMMAEALEKEASWRPLKLQEKEDGITYEDRQAALIWLKKICTGYRFYPEIYALAVTIIDRFLSLVKVQTRYLNCLTLAALQLSVKLQEEDESSPPLTEIVHVSAAGCSTGDIVRMERVILNKLNWSINLVTPLTFLQIFHTHLISLCPQLFSKQLGIGTEGQQRTRLTHRIELYSQTAEFCSYRPALIAVALISLDLEAICVDWFPLCFSLLSLAQVSPSDLISCREHLTQFFISQQKTPELCSHGKRKISHDVIEYHQEDIYDSIKKLYSDDDLPREVLGNED